MKSLSKKNKFSKVGLLSGLLGGWTRAHERLIGYESLVAVLVGFFFLQFFIEHSSTAQTIVVTLFMFLLMEIARMITSRIYLRLFTGVFALSAIISRCVPEIISSPYNSDLLDYSLYFQGITVAVVLYLVQRDIFFGARTMREKVFASICGFLLIALLGAYIYITILTFNPAALSSKNVVDVFNFSTLLYFSVVTLTTLGYGDIVPMANSVARPVVMFQSIAGQLYVVIIISRLVAHTRLPSRKNPYEKRRGIFSRIF